MFINKFVTWTRVLQDGFPYIVQKQFRAWRELTTYSNGRGSPRAFHEFPDYKPVKLGESFLDKSIKDIHIVSSKTFSNDTSDN